MIPNSHADSAFVFCWGEGGGGDYRMGRSGVDDYVREGVTIYGRALLKYTAFG